MKKIVFIFVFIIVSSQLFSQLPQGKLFVYNSNYTINTLGYIQYPQGTYHLIDSSIVKDLIVINDKLYTANNTISIYNIATSHKIDSINTSNAIQLKSWNNKLAVISNNPDSVFNLYDLNTKQLIYSIDTSKLHQIPNDFLISNNKAYLLNLNSVIIIDLALGDTIANINTPYSFWTNGMNEHIVDKDNYIYIDVEYPTGAPRCSMLRLNKQTYVVDDLFEAVILETPYKPVVAKDYIYLARFSTHFDLILDTLIINDTSTYFPISYDTYSNSLFMYAYSSNTIKYFQNNTFSAIATMPTYLQNSYYYNELPQLITDLETKDPIINVYPNPAKDILNIDITNPAIVKNVFIYDVNGRRIDAIYAKINKSLHVDINDLSNGIYMVEILSDKTSYKKKFIKLAY